MPNVTIDGREVNVPDGTTIIRAAEELGIFVPRYCYHPGLSIAGNCRICLVEVEQIPKLQIACNVPVTDGMVVHTKSDKAEEGRRAVLEFLLANHPLDCPVCDQSGECDLQNFYLNFGLYDPRFREHKVKKKKAVTIGPHVMLDQERCILCSRCVRFTDEITKTGEFGIFNRGDRAELALYPGDVLDNAYSANVVDICPVGALTERDFRFKARVWYLTSAPSVCNGCSQGCNIDLHFVLDRPHLNEGARLVRIKPRYNAEVNQWWICDEGRYGFAWVDKNRLTKVCGPSDGSKDPSTHGPTAPQPHSPTVAPSHSPTDPPSHRPTVPQSNRPTVPPSHRPTVPPSHGPTVPRSHRPTVSHPTWDDALTTIAGALRAAAAGQGGSAIGVIASAQMTNEELFLIRELFARGLGAQVTASVAEQPGSSDDFLIKADKNPNTMGATLLGLAGAGSLAAGQLLDEAIGGRLQVLWVFGHDLVQLYGEEKVRQASAQVPLFVYSGTNENPTASMAHWVLPTAAYMEKDGTFVNCHGQVQRIGRAFPPLESCREDWQLLLDLAGKLDQPFPWRELGEIFSELAASVASFDGLSYRNIGLQGAAYSSESAGP